MSARSVSSARRVKTSVTLVVLAMAWGVMASILFLSSGKSSLAAVEAACGSPAPDVRPAASVESVRTFIDHCGTAGIAAYRDLQLIDLLYPITMASLQALALMTLALDLRRRGRRIPLVTLAGLPFVAAAGDYTENVGAWALIVRGVNQTTWAEQMMVVGSAVKVVASCATWCALIVVLAGWVFDAWRRRRHTTTQ